MNKALIFISGLVIGGAAGVGSTYIYMKAKFDERLNTEINSLKAHYVERDKELAKKNEEKKKELEEKIYSPPSDEIENFVDYTKMYSPQYTEDVITNSSIVAYNDLVETEEEVSEAAEIISDVDFENPDFDTYKKISVDYFEDGAVFESLSGVSIDDFESLVGDEWKGAFGEYTPNVVYVRNHKLMTDYEIIEQEGLHPHPEDE